MKRPAGVAASLAIGLLCIAPCARAEPSLSPPKFSVTGGVGNSLGWFGVQAEPYFGDGRFSIFGGLGYAPPLDEPESASGTIAVAGGGRVFFGGRLYRLFIEGSISLIGLESLSTVDGSSQQASRYGPGLQVGFQLLSGKGVTIVGSVGVGYAVGAHSDKTSVLLGLGVGYTWRAH